MQFYLKNTPKNKSFSLLEILIVIFIITLMVGALTPMMSNFDEGRRLETSIIMLVGDLRQTQQFARVQRNGYQYYGLRFFSGLGGGDRFGYKIVRYEPITRNPPIDLTTPNTIIKSSVATDNPELLENTFFGRNVVFNGTSNFSASGALQQIIFTQDGSATTDGEILLTTGTDKIVLAIGGRTSTIQIIGLTGYIKME